MPNSSEALGDLVKNIIDLCPERMKLLGDLIEELKGREAVVCLEQLKKFIRREPCYTKTTRSASALQFKFFPGNTYHHEIESALKKLGLRPATGEELLAYYEANPKMQGYAICTLGVETMYRHPLSERLVNVYHLNGGDNYGEYKNVRLIAFGDFDVDEDICIAAAPVK